MLSVCNSINTNAKTTTVSVSNLSPLAVAYLKSSYLPLWKWLYSSDLKLDNKHAIPLLFLPNISRLLQCITVSLAFIYLLITSNNRPMPWLFLVAVIRPLSMSFSFDASGKVYLAAYLAFYLFLFPSMLWLLICSPSLHTQTHIKHTVSAHRTHISCHASVVGDGWLCSVEVKHGDVGHWSVRGHWVTVQT